MPGKSTNTRLPKSRLGAAFGLAALAAVFALNPTIAPAHVERASYWPASDVEMVGGEPAGGAVPTARSLFTALDAAPAGDTRVVCQTNPSRVNLEVSKSEVDRLTALLAKQRQAAKKAKKKKKKKKHRKKKRAAKRTQQQLAQAQQAYEAALAAEQAARAGAPAQFPPSPINNPSMNRLDAALKDAVDNGYEIRPSEPRVAVTQAEADQLRAFNLQLLAQCRYNEIQPAINDSGNNDRVVVMPGIYTEPTARKAPTFDPACDQYEEQNDTGSTGAASYRYQFHCPNDQNLIAVLGRAPKLNPDGSEFEPPFPDPADPRRNGIPDEGPCIRCNVQLEGSGISADDVVVDSGRVESGNGAPMGSVKDVGIRIDRADGFVLRNMTVRHSLEHDIYSPETDGLLLEDFKTYFNGHYGVLTFVAEHHLIQDCDAAGSGDAAIYPGSSAEYGEQVDPNFDADAQATNHTESGVFGTEIRRCDMRHSNTGYSGTAGNSVHIHDNDFYDNAMGLVTDVFTASGHPGFPQDSDLIEDNEFYSNNFNLYVEDENGELNICDSANGENPGPHGPNQGCTDVIPRIPAPVGTAMFLPGVNNNTIRNNHMWNNWRRGTMLFAVPDSFVCGNVNPIAGGNMQHGCDETEFNTSHRNEQHDNVMGRSPNHAPDPSWPSGQDVEDPNGLDFWWDQGGTPGAANYKNCWYDNDGPEADGSGLTSLPAGPLLPGETTSVQSCATSVGAGSLEGQFAELLNCLGDYEFDTDTCDWFVTPPEPQPTP